MTCYEYYACVFACSLISHSISEKCSCRQQPQQRCQWQKQQPQRYTFVRYECCCFCLVFCFLGEIICYLCTSYSSLVNLFYVPECDKRFFVSAQYFCHKWRVPRSENVYNYAIIFLIEKNRLMKQEVVISAYYAGGNFVHAKIVIAWCLMFEHKKKNQSRNNNENHPSNRSDFRFCQEEI